MINTYYYAIDIPTSIILIMKYEIEEIVFYKQERSYACIST
jgi:hypothetical protein